MKALEDPRELSFGMYYSSCMTDEFEQLIESAKEKMMPFGYKHISPTLVYFKVKGEEVGEYDCCDNESCISKAKKAIRESYGKGTHVEECYTQNDGDHESIDVCYICGIPLNEFLTWCKYELEYIENEPWNAEFFKSDGGTIFSILSSMPTHDLSISDYAKHQGGIILEKALNDREAFFQRIVKLAQAVIDADFTEVNDSKNPTQ